MSGRFAKVPLNLTSSTKQSFSGDSDFGVSVDDVYVESLAFDGDQSSWPASSSKSDYKLSSLTDPLPTLRDKVSGKAFLLSKDWPECMIDSFMENVERTPLRYFIVDDSTSMLAKDGKKSLITDEEHQMVACSRWEELRNSLLFHIEFAQAALAPTQFRLLNATHPVKVGYIPQDKENVEMLLEALNHPPGGETPLCRQIKEIASEIRALEPHLKAHGQRACIIVATDGESSDGDILEALHYLKGLPCRVVARLCTDDVRIVEYWYNIDEQNVVDVDVLDDLTSEAREVRRYNPWLCYNEALHRMREFGATFPEMDLLDESLLSMENMRRVCALIFGPLVLETFCKPHNDWKGFLADVEQGNYGLSQIWSPLDNRQRSWIDVKMLHRCYKRSVMKKRRRLRRSKKPGSEAKSSCVCM